MTSLVAYLLKRLTYATNSLICASESFFLKAGILSRPLLIELKRRSSVTSFCQAASVRSRAWTDRKSTRLNSSHSQISYAVFCLKKKNDQPSMPLSSRGRAQTTDAVTPCDLPASVPSRPTLTPPSNASTRSKLFHVQPYPSTMSE